MRGERQAVSSSWSQSEWVGGVQASRGKSERREGAAGPRGFGCAVQGANAADSALASSRGGPET